jgi:hypothetical protein
MEILSKEIKIPSREIDSIQKGFSFLRWMDAANKSISIFYKKDDEHLLKDKWEVITLLLEREFGGVLPSQFTEMVLFTEGKRELKSAHFFFVDKAIPKSEYLKHSLKSFKNNYHRPNEEAKIIKNTLRIDFKKQVFGNSSFWLVRKYEGVINKAKINWSITKNDGIIIPVKFDNENSNRIINLDEVFYYLYFFKNTNNTLNIIRHFSILGSLGMNGSFTDGHDRFESLSLYNIVSGKQYTLQSSKEMPIETKDFFDNMIISDAIFSETKGINVVILDNGENYFVTLS